MAVARSPLEAYSYVSECNGDVSPTTLRTIVGVPCRDSVKLWMIPVGVMMIALYLWTPKTGKGVAIYGVIALAILIAYFALRE